MNEDWMVELEPRAGEELERRLDRYARLRLDPSPGQAKRARSTVMEAAWRQRLGAVEPASPGLDVAASAASVVAPTRPRRGLFAGWSARRLGVSLSAAMLAGLLVGTSAFASTRAGGLLYDARLAFEELTLPADPQARLEAEIALAQSRVADIVEASSRNDPGAVTAAARGYLHILDDLDESTGGPADRAMVVVEQHRDILRGVLARAPEAARTGIENALMRSSAVIERLDAAGTPPPASGSNGNGPDGGNNGHGTGGTGNGAGNGNAGGNGNGGPAAGSGNGPDSNSGNGPDANSGNGPDANSGNGPDANSGNEGKSPAPATATPRPTKAAPTPTAPPPSVAPTRTPKPPKSPAPSQEKAGGRGDEQADSSGEP